MPLAGLTDAFSFLCLFFFILFSVHRGRNDENITLSELSALGVERAVFYKNNAEVAGPEHEDVKVPLPDHVLP